MSPAVYALVPVLLSLTVTWWAFFRKRATICVAAKSRTLVLVKYPSNPSVEGDFPVWNQEYRYILTDNRRRRWVVSKSAYDWAGVGESITLRQWVDEWRPAGQISHIC